MAVAQVRGKTCLSMAVAQISGQVLSMMAQLQAHFLSVIGSGPGAGQDMFVSPVVQHSGQFFMQLSYLTAHGGGFLCNRLSVIASRLSGPAAPRSLLNSSG